MDRVQMIQLSTCTSEVVGVGQAWADCSAALCLDSDKGPCWLQTAIALSVSADPPWGQASTVPPKSGSLLQHHAVCCRW